MVLPISFDTFLKCSSILNLKSFWDDPQKTFLLLKCQGGWQTLAS